MNGDDVGASNDATCFYNFKVEHIPKDIKKLIGNRNISTNIFRIQAYDSITCGYVCIRFIHFMLIPIYTNLFSPNDCERNGKIILKYFQ